MSTIKDRISVPVDEYTSPCDGWVSEDESVTSVHKKMTEGGYRHMPVLNNGKPVGIISTRDLYLLDQISETASDVTAGMLMTETPFTVITGTPLEEVAYEMSSRKIGSAMVVNPEGEIEGIFTTTDALNALVEILRGELA